MKKTLLFVFAAGSMLVSSAQNKQSKYLMKRPDSFLESSKATGSIFAPVRKTPLVITNSAITDVTLGCANNLLGGWTRPGRPILDYALVGTTGVLTMIHRSGPACTPSDGTPSSGYFTMDYSKDGGATWNPPPSLGPIMDGGANPGRYPSGIIYNPTGNTNPDSAFISFFGPGLSGGGAVPWIAHHTGAAPLGDPTNTRETVDLFDSTVAFHGLIPDAFYKDGTGNTWSIDMGQSGKKSATPYDGDYNDTLIVRKGVWSAANRQHVYTTTLIPFPVTSSAAFGSFAAMSGIAASANGQTVYAALAAHCVADLSQVPDTSYYLNIFKSVNGGTTWTGPSKIFMNCVNAQMGTTGVSYSTAFQIDAGVDNAGKLHLILGIAPKAGTGSITTAAGSHGMFSVITDGNTHSIQLLAKPMTFRGFFGGTAYGEDSRGQIATTAAGDKVFYVWFDTDTNTFPGGVNTNPDAYVRTYDVASGNWGPVTNLTAGSPVDGLVTFGYVANLAGGSASPYKLHLGYQALTGTDTQPVIFHYIGGVTVTTGAGSAGSPCNGLNVQEENTVFEIANSYPNPTSGTSTIEVNMKKADKISVEVANMLGQVIYTTSASLTAGTHKFTVDASKWNAGVYFYTVKSQNFNVTKKLVRE